MITRIAKLGLAFVALILLQAECVTAQQEYQVSVSAGGFDRLETVTSFTLPDDVEPGVYTLRDQSGQEVPLQVDKQNRGWFIIDRLEAGSTATYSLDTSSLHSGNNSSGIAYAVDDRKIRFESNGNEVLSFYHEDNELPDGMDEVYRRGGYIHPVFSPGGTQLTNQLDPKVHTHHYGIWAAWTHTEFQGRTPDFWNIQDRTAEVVRGDSLDQLWQGPVQGGLQAKNYYVDISGEAPVVALNEQWDVKIYNTDADYYIFDVTLTHTTNTMQPLVLPEYRYGGMGFRGHQQWDNPENVTFLTSAGHDRSTGNETRARWSHMGGTVDGSTAGIAVLGHPDNFRAPQPVRIHPDTPYFVYAPMQLGEMSIEPGEPYTMRYRYITYDGEPDPELLDRLWNDYAYPPAVTVESL